MEEKKISVDEVSLFRLQAMIEQVLRLHCEMYAHIAKKEFGEIYDLVWKEVRSSTRELEALHGRLPDDNQGEN